MLTTTDHVMCAVTAALLYVCSKYWLSTDLLVSMTSFMFGWYFYTVYDRYCWARAEQELRKKNNRRL